tara:strand:- start:797 stop:1435 length:639 start_codon:yes stop_codon:yes gene_type:complete
MIKFCFLVDKSNPWINTYCSEFLMSKKLEPTKNIVYEVSDMSNFDVCFVLGYMKKIDITKLPEYCKFFVIHESSLPEGRGFAPVTWQIIEGKNKIDICLIKLEEEFDAGDIVLKDKIILDGDELYDEIRHKQACTTFKLIDEFLSIYPEIDSEEQSGEASYYKRRSPEDSKIDPNKSIAEQFDLIRTCNNDDWPAFFEMRNKSYILKIYKNE